MKLMHDCTKKIIIFSPPIVQFFWSGLADDKKREYKFSIRHNEPYNKKVKKK